MSEDRPCYNYRGTHIPGCIGCAVGGHDRCTCPDPGAPLKRRVERLEHEVEDLQLRLARLTPEKT